MTSPPSTPPSPASRALDERQAKIVEMRYFWRSHHRRNGAGARHLRRNREARVDAGARGWQARALQRSVSVDGQRWQRVKEIFSAALEQDAVASARLSTTPAAAMRRCAPRWTPSSPPTRTPKTAPSTVPPCTAPWNWRPNPQPVNWIGRRVGDYRIVEEVGRGGMSEVYKGVRDDDEYHKEVAVKVLRERLRHARAAEALQGRDADSRDAGPSEHRATARCGQHARGPALPRDGLHQGRADRRVLPPEQVEPRRAAGVVPKALRSGSVRAPAPDGSRRPEVQQRAGVGTRRGEAARLRHRATAGAELVTGHAGRETNRDRRHDAGVRESRADSGRRDHDVE